MDFLTRHVPGIRGIAVESDFAVDADDAALVYYRVSDRSQVDTDYDPEGNSLPAQREFVEETARRLGKTIVGEYVEPGVSALPIDKRPAFREMIDRIITCRDAKYIIVYMLNRFARNRYEDAIVGMTLERLGVTVISAKEHIHGNDPSQRMMRGMLAVINQYQSEASSADIKEKLAHKARKGGTIGYAPIGYLNVRKEFDGRKVNTVTVDPLRSPYITHIFELYATGRYSIADIHDIITEQGLRTRPTKRHPTGTPLARSRIAKIITDRYYCGYIHHNGIEYKGRHQPLVTEELFDKVQGVLNANSHSGIRRRIHHHPLKGLLRCGHCKRRLILAQATGNGGTYLYMFCMGRKTGACHLPYLRLDGPRGIETAVSNHYQTVTLSGQTRRELVEHLDKAIQAEQALSTHMRTQLSTKLDQLTTREDALFALVGHLEWDQVKLNQQMRQLRKERATTQQQLSDLETVLDVGRQIFLTALDLLAQPRHVYDTENAAIKTLLTKTIFGTIHLVADPDGTVTAVHSELAEPFNTITTTAHDGYQLTRTITTTDATGPQPQADPHTDLAPWRPHHSNQGDNLPKEAAALGNQQTYRANGSNKPCLVGTTGFEPATP